MEARRWIILLGLLVCATMTTVVAQSTRPLFTPSSISNFRFNFLNPGGRATGMGNAFIAQGNDATGSEINPAGLLFIPKPMIFAEYRFFRYEYSRPYDATYAETSPGYTQAQELIYRDFTNDINSVPFISFVYPSRKWAVAFYRQELANFETDYANESLHIPQDISSDDLWVMNRDAVNLKFKLVNWGATFAGRLHEKFAVGFSVRAAEMTMKVNETADFDPAAWPLRVNFSNVFTSPDRDQGIGMYQTADDKSWGVSFVAGFQIKPNDYISIGAVYRYGEKHKISTTFAENIYQFNYQTGQLDLLRVDYPSFEINVPDRIGAGVSIMPTDTFTINFDVVNIRYTDLNDQFLAVIDPQDPGNSQSISPYLGWENGTEVRVGAEYLIPIGATDSISFRGGYYREADPSIHYLGGLQNEDPLSDLFYNTFNPAMGYENHGTFGFGMVVFRNVQIDLAGDIGKHRKYFAISAMYNFGD